MNNQEFIPREALERAFRHWWMIVLLTVLGGIVGWTFHFFNPPLYEATAVLTANMDFQKRQLTQYEEDYAFGTVTALSTWDDVVNQVATDAKAQGILIQINQLKQQMSVERRQSVMELHIMNPDPKVAAELANIWVKTYYDALNAALTHAIRADQIQSQIGGINNSLSAAGAPVLSPETKDALKNLSDQLLQEQQLSHGIISIMKFSLSESAAVPQKPVTYYWANLVLAGACIGFIVSLWAAGSYGAQRHA